MYLSLTHSVFADVLSFSESFFNESFCKLNIRDNEITMIIAYCCLIKS